MLGLPLQTGDPLSGGKVVSFPCTSGEGGVLIESALKTITTDISEHHCLLVERAVHRRGRKFTCLYPGHIRIYLDYR